MNWEKKVINGKEFYVAEVTEADKSLAETNSNTKRKSRLDEDLSLTDMLGGVIPTEDCR